MLKESKIGIVIIAAIIVLGIVFLSINLKNVDRNDGASNEKVKVYNGFDKSLLSTDANKLSYSTLTNDNIKNLFIASMNRANIINTKTLEDFKLNIIPDTNSGDMFKYTATGEFKCNNHPKCEASVIEGYSCDKELCISLPVDDYNESTGYFTYKVDFSITLDDGKYTFNEFEVGDRVPVKDIVKVEE